MTTRVAYVARAPGRGRARRCFRMVGLTVICLSAVSWPPRLLGQAPSSPGPQAIGITEPFPGSSVLPGTVLDVKLAVSRASGFDEAGIIVEDLGFGPYAVAETSSLVPTVLTFAVGIPNDTVGPRKIAAFGVAATGDEAFFGPVIIDVEPQGPVESLEVEPGDICCLSLGDQIPLRVLANFAPASGSPAPVSARTLDVTHSTRTVFSPDDSSVATVSDGVVTCVAPGTLDGTEITVTFEGATAVIPVSTVQFAAAATPTSAESPGEILSPEAAPSPTESPSEPESR